MKQAVFRIALLACSITIFPALVQAIQKRTPEEILQQLDFDGDGRLSEVELAAGFEHRAETDAGRKPVIKLASFRGRKGLRRADLGKLDESVDTWVRLFKNQRFGGANPTVATIVNDRRFEMNRWFALGDTLIEEPENETGRWIPEDEKPLRVRRTLEDLNTDDADLAKGALASYANDFNTQSEQWAFHGVIGLNLVQQRNILAYSQKEIDGPKGWLKQWLRPSIAFDKVTTTQSDRDEIDSLIPRLGVGGLYEGRQWSLGLFDGFRVNVNSSYATDSNGDRRVVAGEVDFAPYRWARRLAKTPADGRTPFERNVDLEEETGIPVDDPRFQHPGLEDGLAINGAFQRFGLIYFRLEALLHMEGGSVLEDAGDPALQASSDFLRLGGTAGVTFGFYAIERLRLHTHFQYGVEVAGDGPDVDQFLGSADWRLDEEGRFTLTAEYRNGRSPLLVQRDDRLTLGLGVKF